MVIISFFCYLMYYQFDNFIHFLKFYIKNFIYFLRLALNMHKKFKI